ncbi:hypothetical protein HYX07_05445 [Candidatus Woesearchaeota archaeon]|nr:hypothetical protein [Candidatus Woesearchaeota archaeon]
MLKRIYISHILILLVLVISCTPQTPEESSLPSKIKQTEKQKTTPSDFLTYENSDYGVKIKYPSDWEKKETEDLIIAFVSPKTGASDAVQENLGLTMNDLAGQYLTLQDYNKIAIEQLKQTFPDIKFIESGSTTVSNTPAYKVVFTASNLKFMQAWTIKNDLAYVWSYVAAESAFSDYLGIVQKMLDSFEITRNIRATAEEKTEQKTVINSVADADPAFVGSWSIFSERIFYNIGGAGSMAVPVTRNLELLKDGAWKFGDSNGKWTMTEITSEDWTRWGVNPYGPTRKVVLDKWNNAVADGPVEESKGYVEFIWVIYHVEPPQVQNAGTVWMKFGHG